MTKLAIAALCAGLALASTVRADEYRESVRVRAGGTLEVELAAGAIEIETHDENSVDVEASTGSWAGALRFELSGDGTNAKLVGSRAGWLPGGFGTRVRVRVPETYSLDMKTGGGAIEIEAVRGRVHAETGGGGIRLDGALGPVELSTSGGGLRVADVQGDTVLRTSGGSIRVSDVVGDVEARTSGGSIRIQEVEGRVSARTSGGSVTVRFDGAPAGELRTSGGGIEVEFPEGQGAELEARTSGGRISIDAPFQSAGGLSGDRVTGRLGPGGATLELLTTGGNIRVRER